MPTVAGQRTQPSDLLRRHETARDHAPLGDLGQPHAVGSIRLRPAGQRLDLLGVQQVAVEPLGLQPEERRLPVIRRCLHHHRRHPMAAQPIGQRQDLPLGRAEAAHLVRPPPRVRLARHPDTGFQRALADIECSHPLDVQRLVVDLLHHPPHLHLDAATCATGRGAEGDTEIWPACSKRQGTTLNENRLPASDSSTDSRRAPRSYDVTDGHPPIFTKDRRPAGTLTHLTLVSTLPPPRADGAALIAHPQAGGTPPRSSGTGAVAVGLLGRLPNRDKLNDAPNAPYVIERTAGAPPDLTRVRLTPVRRTSTPRTGLVDGLCAR